jgi:hypothetical protein
MVMIAWTHERKNMNTGLLKRCRDKLVAIAHKGERIPYSELAKHVGVANQGLRPYLNQIYEEEIALAHPDLTLVAVYVGTKYGRYNSRGAEAQSVQIDPSNAADVAAYEADVARVYQHWKSQP